MMRWARLCAGHVLPLVGRRIDRRLTGALAVAEKREKGDATTGEARQASLGALAAANEASDPIIAAVARAVAHAAATSHMADHALGAALYALLAVKRAGGPVEAERKWQNGRLPAGITRLILSARSRKEKHFNLS